MDSVATYTCNTGYRLSNTLYGQRMCQDNGSWTGQTPSCQIIGKCSGRVMNEKLTFYFNNLYFMRIQEKHKILCSLNDLFESRVLLV